MSGKHIKHEQEMEDEVRNPAKRDLEDDEEEEDDDVPAVSKQEMAQEHLKGLAQCVRRRVKALENIQKAHGEIDRQYRDELDALERKYMALHAPLQARRAAIVAGEAEVTDAEAAGFEPEPSAPADVVQGVPLFWYHALANNEAVRSLTALSERDREALAALRDIRYALLPRTRDVVEGREVTRHGFSLTFVFGENEFFSDRELVKTYYLTEDETGEPMFDRSEATKPQWLPGKNLTVRVIKKAMPRPKRAGRGGRAAPGPQFQTVEEPCESFFHFFNPVQMPNPGEEMDPDEFDELSDAVQGDFEAGCEIRDCICPKAVMWYNGQAVEEDDEDEDDEEDEEDWDDEEDDDDDDDEEDEDDDEDDDDDDDVVPKRKALPQGHKFAPPPGSSTQPSENPECKQQ
eukprot:m51a1_g4456 putative nucleosome assembly protein 1-like protein (403) ;mRNA; f:175801-177480